MSDNTTNTPDSNQPAPLSGNDAVNLAAEQAKTTSDKNITPFPGLPVAEDTANLRQGPNLHDGLLALLPLVGVWRGEGQADTGEDGPFAFGQQITVSHCGQNYLSYESRIYRLDEEGNPAGLDQRETGFWRISDKDEIEFICTHSSGIVEIFYGQPLNERAWELESASTMVTATGPTTLGPGKRLYGLLPTNELGWVDERLVDGALKPRMSAQLRRVAG
ncbi:FABP family protein [Corynebacterium aquilae]|uniref:Ferric nitrobindin-like protein n=1 Tax=Corynebacterium aquilae DSM 44791 TaxID=1431546 RepID=A0A1L7CHR1_9CORY|nr:FABP family protein [Corynebacterium aquilae]APT85391.1 fatty acid-binding protein [Corynebacterium aquilae DSM 44791]